VRAMEAGFTSALRKPLPDKIMKDCLRIRREGTENGARSGRRHRSGALAAERDGIQRSLTLDWQARFAGSMSRLAPIILAVGFRGFFASRERRYPGRHGVHYLDLAADLFGPLEPGSDRGRLARRREANAEYHLRHRRGRAGATCDCRRDRNCKTHWSR